ncbi:peroxisomal ATPase PEX6-like isoform X2 [Phragmites australis]|uniref:peroxisomal ATPase PEX6-like isoform X2 n=1 Tax=Phragmites australis TaxID=29695 RepID=UPI002D77A021|nr:peroxisomal ATPase PEX6-like isoform X2 [Phragmites australis]
MEHSSSSSLFASVVGVGVGVGLGLGLVSARLALSTPGGGSGGGASAKEVEAELRRLVVDGRETGVTFSNFPYYFSEQTRLALTSAAYPYLSQTVLPKHIQVFSDTSRTILLCGPSETCLQSLAKAVAHEFNARLLALDIFELSRQIQHKYGSPSNAQVPKGSTTESTLDRVYGFVESFNILRKKAEPTGSSDHEKGILDLRTSYCRYKNIQSLGVPGAKDNDSEFMEDDDLVRRSWGLDEKILIQALYKIIVSVSECSPVILYIRDVNLFLDSSERAYSMFQKMLNKLSGRVLIIGSYFLNADQDSDDVDEDVSDLFPYILETKPPKEEDHLEKWKTQMESDMAKIQSEMFINYVTEILSANNLECGDFSSVSPDDYVAITNYINEIMAPAVSYHLMNNKDPEYKNGRLVVSSTSLSHGLRIFQESNLGKDTVETDESKVTKYNEYEKRIRESVIPASETGVTFDDIGALADIKESIQELVMLPLQRPDLFNGGLLKPCRGVLLFGPPGTGKTMLAKAIANEAGASFMNISMSFITSKWYGEAEKSIRALFSLAAKIAPAIIFVDEVDSMLGTRERSNENEVSRRIKNEFMTHWDGLLSKSNERILVLAATNRPFDLDEAIIRRFEHRIMVGLPTRESRELILKKLLSKEKVENIDFKELAKMTEGYSGSDLKNLCVTAAYGPLRELLRKEKERKKDKKEKEVKVEDEQAENLKNEESGKEKPESSKGKKDESEKGIKGETEETDETTAIRPLNMEDLRQAKDQVAASFASGGVVMNDIKEWNELYGKGGSRKKQQPTYFL